MGRYKLGNLWLIYMGYLVCTFVPQSLHWVAAERAGEARGGGKEVQGVTGSGMIPKELRRVADLDDMDARSSRFSKAMGSNSRAESFGGVESVLQPRLRSDRKGQLARVREHDSQPAQTIQAKNDEIRHGVGILRSMGDASNVHDRQATEDTSVRERWADSEFLEMACYCEGGCRTIEARSGVLNHGAREMCSKSGATGRYGARHNCWWIIKAEPNSTLTVTKVMISSVITRMQLCFCLLKSSLSETRVTPH